MEKNNTEQTPETSDSSAKNESAGDIELVYYPDDLLRQSTTKVKDIDDVLRTTIDRMVLLMQHARGIGLAAPQVGILERFFVVQVDNDPVHVFVNPSIVGTSHETGVYEEGCLSIPGLYADVKRPSEIQVQAWNQNGRPFTLNADGMLARVILHELDHLNGVLFLDHLAERKREKLLQRYRRPQESAR
jgi:peptide deformylase